jgi:hypothetical protein
VSYRYAITPAEAAAAELLRTKGWTVAEPRCPDCFGWGQQSYIEAGVESKWIAGFMTRKTRPCPQGCPTPNFYYSSSAATVSL